MQQQKIPVTYGLITVCVVLFLGSYLFPGLTTSMLFEPFAAYYQPWRFLTAAFQHADLLHLLSNMAFLYVLGIYAQNLLSQWDYLILFILSALGGAAGTLVWCTLIGQSQATVGASGATLGICAALFVITRHFDRNGVQLGGLLLINILLGFFLPMVAWHAHVGGAIVGLGLGYGYQQVARQAWKARQDAYGQPGQILDIVDRARYQRKAQLWSKWGNSAVNLIGLIFILVVVACCYATATVSSW